MHNFFTSHLNKICELNKYSILLLLVFVTTSCTFATVRSLDEDEEAKAGFSAEDYASDIWDAELMPTIEENAVEFTELVAQIREDEDAAIEQFGSRSGTGAFSFMTRGEAQVLEAQLDSRIGFVTLDFAPFDGEADASLAVGPVIRNRDNSVRDAVGFIRLNDFLNQTEFATVSSALKDYILANVIAGIDLENLPGNTITFLGTFTLSNVDDIEIVPVRLTVESS